MLKIVGLEEELSTRKTHNPIQNKENQPMLMLDRDAEIPIDPPVTAPVNKRAKAALEPYKALSGQIDELENCFNVQLKERSAPEMALFRSNLDKVKAEVGKLHQHHFMVSIDPVAKDSEGEIPMLDLMKKPVNKKKKKVEKKGKKEMPDNDEERKVEKRARKKSKKKEIKKMRIESLVDNER
ncbi:hypothetical protein FXO38_34429 [Capsicum annuum]|nr:hypothetical protein FXO38_34429 [Capsicum annuum]